LHPKFEIRITKSETNSKYEKEKLQTKQVQQPGCLEQPGCFLSLPVIDHRRRRRLLRFVLVLLGVPADEVDEQGEVASAS
jgi:hypothetical protein